MKKTKKRKVEAIGERKYHYTITEDRKTERSTMRGKEQPVPGTGNLSITHNGILVHVAVESGGKRESRLLSLQEQGSPTRFRNIWFKPAT